MDTQGRIGVALARVDAGRDFLKRAAASGPPCLECYYCLGAYCSHPAHTDLAFNPANGKIKESIEVTVEQARATDGLCGPEAALFYERTDLLAFIKLNLPEIKRYAWLSFAWLLTSTVFGLFAYAFLLSP